MCTSKNLGNAIYSCQVRRMHVLAMTPWKIRKTAKSWKGETRVPNAIIGTNQLRETTPTEKPRSSKEAGVEHKASNLVSKKKYSLKNLDICREIQDSTWVVALIKKINPLNAELNPICSLLALLGAHDFLHFSRIRVKSLTLGLLMSYIYIWSTHSWCF